MQDLSPAETDPTQDAPRPFAGHVIDGRYTVIDLLGYGGFGSVFRATDGLSGQVVAVKWLHRLHERDAARLRREVAALRLLRLPGVVRLLDEGEHQGHRYLVMEYIEGRQFPGTAPRCSWADLVKPAISLLGAVARIHESGVVHRDLKPANVLVQADGSVVVLDFGIVTGGPVGQTVSGEAGVVGTPGYLAPELVMGYRADPRADLYACGVMLYEALAGRRPLRVGNALAMLRAAVLDEPDPLLSTGADVPPEVASCIDRLLASNPAHRPATAMEVARILGGKSSIGAGEFPWLGGRALAQDLADALLAGRSAELVGAEGSGKSAVAAQVTALLRARGVAVVALVAGKAPLASLGPLAPAAADMRQLDLPAAMAAALDQARAALHAGAALVFDDADLCDRWSAQILCQLQSEGALPILRTAKASGPGARVLEPLTEGQLAELFAGPERLLHLPSDGARLLYLRTGGNPARVQREVATWVRAGLARWRDRRLVVARADLTRLRNEAALPVAAAGADASAQLLVAQLDTAPMRAPTPRTKERERESARDWQNGTSSNELLAWVHLAWPHTHLRSLAPLLDQPPWRLQAALEELAERGAVALLADGRYEPRWQLPPLGMWLADELADIHRKIAHSLAPGAERRLFHLVAADAVAEVAQEAVQVAAAQWHDGRLASAQATVVDSLLVVRREPTAPGEAMLLCLLTKLALAELTLPAVERAQYEIGRARAPGPLHGVCKRLLALGLEVVRHRGEGLLEALCTPLGYGDDELELARCSMALLVGRSAPLQREREVAEQVVAWAAAAGSPLLSATADHWLGRLRYGEARYREAADLQLPAIALGRPQSLVVQAQLTRADCLMELREFAEAEQLARQAAQAARERFLPSVEAHAEWLIRACAYRQGAVLAPDTELAAAAAVASVGHWEAVICLTESAFAWRSGALAQARQLGKQSRAAADRSSLGTIAMLAALLAALVDGHLDPADAELAAEQARAATDPRTAYELFGILAAFSPAWREEALGQVMALRPALAPADWHARVDLLAPAEVFALVSGLQGVSEQPANTPWVFSPVG